MCRTTLGGDICLYSCRAGCSSQIRRKKKKKEQIYGFSLKPLAVKDLPATKVVTMLHVLLAPGLPLFQYLLYCPVAKPLHPC